MSSTVELTPKKADLKKGKKKEKTHLGLRRRKKLLNRHDHLLVRAENNTQKRERAGR